MLNRVHHNFNTEYISYFFARFLTKSIKIVQNVYAKMKTTEIGVMKGENEMAGDPIHTRS